MPAPQIIGGLDSINMRQFPESMDMSNINIHPAAQNKIIPTPNDLSMKLTLTISKTIDRRFQRTGKAMKTTFKRFFRRFLVVMTMMPREHECEIFECQSN